MCGIFSLLNNYNYQAFSQTFVETQFNKGVNARTKYSELKYVGHKITMGVHDNEKSIDNIQPIIYNDIVLICDGEVFNYKQLYEYMGITSPITTRSCEVIIYLYMKYGIEYTLQVIDGEYAFILLDNCVHTDNYNLFVVRDPFGVKPLYILHPEKNESIDERKRIIGFSSEKKLLNDFFDILENMEYREKDKDKTKEPPKYYLKQFQPGTYSSYYLSSKVFSSWTVGKKFERYYSNAFSSFTNITLPQYIRENIDKNIYEYLFEAIRKRCDIVKQQQEKIVCLIITGDYESSQILSSIKTYCSLFCDPSLDIETYSIGVEGSEELKNAKKIADQFGTKHNEIIYAPKNNEPVEMDNEIDLIGKYISENSNSKLVFVADGFCELSGSQFIYIKDPIEFDKNVREQINNIHNTKLLRLNKCFYSYGIEITTPYLDRAYVQHYLSISAEIRSSELSRKLN